MVHLALACTCASRPAARKQATSMPQRRRTTRSSAVASVKDIPATDGKAQSHEADVVVIGAGIGGLSCAAILAKYGLDVTVLESHDVVGGAAHAWERDGYHFESGPSLYSGMADRGVGANPLSHIFQAIGEPLPLVKYNKWNVLLPEGEFLTRVGATQFLEVLQEVRGDAAVQEWKQLQEFMRPYAAAASAVPPAALRADLGAAVTALARYSPSLLSNGSRAGQLVQPFGDLVGGVVRDPFIKNWLDLLCFLLSGLPASGTIAAEVAFMFNEWYKPESTLEFPVGGSQAMADALARGVRRRGGRVHVRSHVEQILLDDTSGRACGARVRGGAEIRARRAVVTNATLWDARGLLPPGALPDAFERDVEALPATRSFMHLHVGFDAAGIDPEMHHIVVNTWEGGVDTEQNVVLISIASVADPTMAPEGKHVLHAYTPATEPFELWEGLDRKSEEYAQLKEERSQVLWKAVERVIPDIRERAEMSFVGTPLTHRRYLRRHAGSYGPGLPAGAGAMLPSCKTPLPGLYACGDTTFPGIGLPAVAASGMVAANTIVPVPDHWRLLDEMGL